MGVEIDLDVPRKEENVRTLTDRNQLFKSENDILKNVRVFVTCQDCEKTKYSFKQKSST